MAAPVWKILDQPLYMLLCVHALNLLLWSFVLCYPRNTKSGINYEVFWNRQTLTRAMWLFATVPELKAQYAGKKIKISSELYKKGCVSNPEEGLVAAQKIGFPVMIKASEGGGGKGIRKVEASEEFASSFRQVREWQNKNGLLTISYKFFAVTLMRQNFWIFSMVSRL